MRIVPAISRYVWLEEEIRNEIIAFLIRSGPATAQQLEDRLGCALPTYLKRLEEQGEITRENGYYRRDSDKAIAAGAGVL